MIKFINMLKSRFSIDCHVFFSILLRLWSMFAGGLLMLVIPFVFDSNEQGYYFTFSSLVALQVFFELGLNYVVVQMVAHEMPYVNYASGVFKGNELHSDKILHLVYLLRKWYSVISVLYFVVVLIVGIFFFINNGSLPLNNWIYAWVILVLFSSLNLFSSPFLSVLEGMGLVADVAKTRLLQSIIGYSLLFLFFILDVDLIAISIIPCVASLYSLFWIFRYHRFVFLTPSHAYNANLISWKRDIFPFQWRIAVSWLSGYFIFQIFTPVIFANQGPVEAGKIGLTMTIFSTLISVSMSWISARNNVFARLISENKRREVNQLFWRTTISSGALNLLVVVSFVSVILLMKCFSFSFVERMADIKIILLLSIAAICNHFVFSIAVYMRAHKEEPMLICSVLSACLIAVSAYYMSHISSFATIAAYVAVVCFVGLPWSYYLFLGYYRR